MALPLPDARQLSDEVLETLRLRAVRKLGLDNQGLGEVLAVVGLFNQMNKLADDYQVEPDILPTPN